MNPQYRPHIAVLLLALSFTLALPLAWWHDCESVNPSKPSVSTQDVQFSLAHPDCALCDFVLTPFPVVEDQLPIGTVDYLPSASIATPRLALVGFLISPPLRAPPLS